MKEFFYSLTMLCQTGGIGGYIIAFVAVALIICVACVMAYAISSFLIDHLCSQCDEEKVEHKFNVGDKATYRGISCTIDSVIVAKFNDGETSKVLYEIKFDVLMDNMIVRENSLKEKRDGDNE